MHRILQSPYHKKALSFNRVLSTLLLGNATLNGKSSGSPLAPHHHKIVKGMDFHF